MFVGRKKYLIKPFLISLLISVYSWSFAQNIAVKAKIDSNNILLGDWIKYSLEISSPNSVEVIWPYFPDSFGHFSIVERSAIDSSEENNRITRRQIITLTSFDSGTFAIPSLKISYRPKFSRDFKEVITDTFLVNVRYMVADTSQPIKPIKPPIRIPVAFKEIVPFLLGWLVIAVLVLLFLLYLRRRKKNKPFFSRQKPKIPPHLIAIEQLKDLENQKLWQKGEIKKYHIVLTDIIRQYIEDQFLQPALESTTAEIIENLGSKIDDPSLLTHLRNFLELSDLVKFAKLQPLPDENEKCLNAAYEFVNSTKPTDIHIENKEAPTE